MVSFIGHICNSLEEARKPVKALTRHGSVLWTLDPRGLASEVQMDL